jgi:hypothetical protein
MQFERGVDTGHIISVFMILLLHDDFKHCFHCTLFSQKLHRNTNIKF